MREIITKRNIIITIVVAVAIGISAYFYFREEVPEPVNPIEVVLFRWNVQETESAAQEFGSWHPTENKGRSDVIIETARAANPLFALKSIEEFETKDLDAEQYLMLTYDEELLPERTVVFSQKGLISPEPTEVKVQRQGNEGWAAFYERGFRQLSETKAVPPPKAKKPPDSAKAKVKAEKDEDAGTDADEDKPDEVERLFKFQIFFDWQPGIEPIQALQYHPYVVENLDRTILFSASNLGLEARKLLKLDVADFNDPANKIILIFSPEGIKNETVKFAIRNLSLEIDENNDLGASRNTIMIDIKRKKNEDWNEFYTRGFCTIAKKAKIIKECKLQYQ